jgi:hypothetical protein
MDKKMHEPHHLEPILRETSEDRVRGAHEHPVGR